MPTRPAAAFEVPSIPIPSCHQDLVFRHPGLDTRYPCAHTLPRRVARSCGRVGQLCRSIGIIICGPGSSSQRSKLLSVLVNDPATEEEPTRPGHETSRDKTGPGLETFAPRRQGAAEKGTLPLILHRLSHRFSRYHTVPHTSKTFHLLVWPTWIFRIGIRVQHHLLVFRKGDQESSECVLVKQEFGIPPVVHVAKLGIMHAVVGVLTSN